MIVAPQPEAVDAGAEILRAGGNAVDAAICCALVQGVVDPLMCGIAGFGSMHLYLPGAGAHELIDFHARAPQAARPDMWVDRIEGETQDGFGFILKDRVNDVGYQSIAVPGSILAYFEAHADFGRLPWADVMAPAIRYADEGHLVRPAEFRFWIEPDFHGRTQVVDRLRFTESGRKIFFDGEEKLLLPGARLRNPDLAETLRILAKEGAAAFYTGVIAEKIVEDMAANGGIISAADLSGYRTRRGKPLWSSYRGYGIATNMPPGGGLQLVELLNILEAFDLAGLGHNSIDYLATLAEAMKQATVDKDDFIGDPDFLDVPVDRLSSKEYARDVAERICRGEKTSVPRLKGGLPTKDTTHISVVDCEGNAVSMTHSLGMPSGVISTGLGFMYNGCMGVFDPRPGRAGSIAPGKSRFSSMCPSIVFSDGKPAIVIGAPGATQISLGVLQVLLNALDFGMPIAEAVAAPRISATSDTIEISNRFPTATERGLQERGYDVQRSHMSFTVASVHAIQVWHGKLKGAADPGLDGMALAVIH